MKTSEFIIKTNPLGYGEENNLIIFKLPSQWQRTEVCLSEFCYNDLFDELPLTFHLSDHSERNDPNKGSHYIPSVASIASKISCC